MEWFLNKLIELVCRILGRTNYISNANLEKLFLSRDSLTILNRINEKEKINVAFFFLSVPTWKYESLYNAMLNDERFNPILFISPRNDVWSSRKKVIADIVNYCRVKNYCYVSLKNNYLNIGRNIKKYNIDIAFYSQPYDRIYCKEYYYDKMNSSLLCYIPYGYIYSHTDYCYTSILHKICWKHYLPSMACVEAGNKYLPEINNRVFVGNPYYDNYCNCKPASWKSEKLKKIIWAPHHSILSNGWLHISCFMEIYQDMLDLANKYKSQIQIAFKPHPHLFPALCSLWGVSKTEEYYKKWKDQPNTMLCESESYPLFKSSDAMIHDCASFLMEYFYTQKPCLYVALSGKIQMDLDEQGTDAFNAHYHAYKKDEIEHFIIDVILEGNDYLVEDRKNVFEKYIKPKTGESATDNILRDIKLSLGI